MPDSARVIEERSTITCDRKALAEALGRVAHCVDGRASLPILSTARLTAKDGRLRIATTNLDMVFETWIDCEHQPAAEFDLCLPQPRGWSKALLRALGINDVALTILRATGDLRIKSGPFDASVMPLLSEDFPEIDVVDEPDWRSDLTWKDMALLKRVAPAASSDHSRYYLHGVLFEHVAGEPWRHRLVATDGHRLHLAELQLPSAKGSFPDGWSMIIPSGAVKAILKHFAEPQYRATLSVHPRRKANAQEGMIKDLDTSNSVLRAELVNLQVTARLIDGTFPDYRRAIPKAGTRFSMDFSAGALRSAVQSICALASTKEDPLVVIEPGEDGLTAHIKRRWSALAASTEHSVAFEGRAMDDLLGVNARYLLDLIKVCGGDTITFAANDARGPIRVFNRDDAAFLAVQMPMRV